MGNNHFRLQALLNIYYTHKNKTKCTTCFRGVFEAEQKEFQNKRLAFEKLIINPDPQ